MKLLTVTVPCYNSAAYMEKCINSLLIGGEDIEIIIVDDGSKDDTAQIADRLAAEYPTIIRAIHQPNGGHGEAVNTGIANASGYYFKVVDSDDWVKEEAFVEVLRKLKDLTGGNTVLDMMIANFVYEKEGEKHKHVMQYRHALPQNQLFTWSDVGHFKKGQYILMHSVIFRTKLLVESGMKLPSHTFYVDNLFVFEPLPYVKNMYYIDVNLYRYFIGREDQSVNERVMISRVDQQIRVNKLMVDYFASKHASLLTNRQLLKYMRNYLDIITTISSVLLILSKDEENLKKKKELWDYIKEKDYILFRSLRYGLLGSCMNLPGKGGRRISTDGYHICQKIFHFN